LNRLGAAPSCPGSRSTSSPFGLHRRRTFRSAWAAASGCQLRSVGLSMRFRFGNARQAVSGPPLPGRRRPRVLRLPTRCRAPAAPTAQSLPRCESRRQGKPDAPWRPRASEGRRPLVEGGRGGQSAKQTVLKSGHSGQGCACLPAGARERHQTNVSLDSSLLAGTYEPRAVKPCLPDCPPAAEAAAFGRAVLNLRNRSENAPQHQRECMARPATMMTTRRPRRHLLSLTTNCRAAAEGRGLHVFGWTARR